MEKVKVSVSQSGSKEFPLRISFQSPTDKIEYALVEMGFLPSLIKYEATNRVSGYTNPGRSREEDPIISYVDARDADTVTAYLNDITEALENGSVREQSGVEFELEGVRQVIIDARNLVSQTNQQKK